MKKCWYPSKLRKTNGFMCIVTVYTFYLWSAFLPAFRVKVKYDDSGSGTCLTVKLNTTYKVHDVSMYSSSHSIAASEKGLLVYMSTVHIG